MSVAGENAAPHLRAVPAPVDDGATGGLTVVEGRLGLATRIARFLGSTLLVTFVIGLVGALVLHATIVETQRALDERQEQITALEDETEAMRHELAQLEAPARVVAAAKALGMIEAPSILYLNVPVGSLDERTLRVAENQLVRTGR